MCRKVLFVTIVILLMSTVAFGRRSRSADIRQKQSTNLVVMGSTWGIGLGTTTTGGSVYATQRASEGRSNRATQTASTSVGSSTSWFGAASAWFWGWATTDQKQKVD